MDMHERSTAGSSSVYYETKLESLKLSDFIMGKPLG